MFCVDDMVLCCRSANLWRTYMRIVKCMEHLELPVAIHLQLKTWLTLAWHDDDDAGCCLPGHLPLRIGRSLRFQLLGRGRCGMGVFVEFGVLGTVFAHSAKVPLRLLTAARYVVSCVCMWMRRAANLRRSFNDCSKAMFSFRLIRV